MHRASAHIDLHQFGQNLKNIRQTLKKQTKLMLVIKANAYGHGAPEMAKKAMEEGVDYLGVACPDEGISLRKNGITTPILLLSEPVKPDLSRLLDFNFTFTLYSKEFISELQNAAKNQKKTISIHLKIDTGMSRLGCLPQDAPGLAKQLGTCPNLIPEGVYTHFANSSEAPAAYSKKQLTLFLEILEKIKSDGPNFAIRHAANSSAAQHFPESHLDMVRIGLSAYENALTLKSTINIVKKVPAGQPIGYDGIYVTDRPTHIATVNIGYADGIPMALCQGEHVLIKEKKYPIVGKICMDMLLVDVGENKQNIDNADEVVIFGNQGTQKIPLSEICERKNLNPRAVTCGLGPRVHRFY